MEKHSPIWEIVKRTHGEFISENLINAAKQDPASTQEKLREIARRLEQTPLLNTLNEISRKVATALDPVHSSITPGCISPNLYAPQKTGGPRSELYEFWDRAVIIHNEDIDWQKSRFPQLPFSHLDAMSWNFILVASLAQIHYRTHSDSESCILWINVSKLPGLYKYMQSDIERKQGADYFADKIPAMIPAIYPNKLGFYVRWRLYAVTDKLPAIGSPGEKSPQFGDKKLAAGTSWGYCDKNIRMVDPGIFAKFAFRWQREQKAWDLVYSALFPSVGTENFRAIRQSRK